MWKALSYSHSISGVLQRKNSTVEELSSSFKLSTCSYFVFVVVIRYPEKYILEKKEFSVFNPRLQSIIAGELKKESETPHLLACFLLGSSYTVQDPTQGDGAAHKGLGLPISVNNKDNPL